MENFGVFEKSQMYKKLSNNCVQVHVYFNILNCQALSISQSLNLSLSLRDRDRADTTITFHPPPPETF